MVADATATPAAVAGSRPVTPCLFLWSDGEWPSHPDARQAALQGCPGRADGVDGMDPSSRFAAYVGRVEDIRPGSSRLLRVAGRDIAVFAVDGEFFAIANECPHHGASLVEGRVRNGNVLCPWHAWHVSLKTGECFEAPYRPAQTYPTEVRNGQLLVLVPRSLPAPGPAHALGPEAQAVEVGARRGVH